MMGQMLWGFGTPSAGAQLLLAQCLTPLFVFTLVVGVLAAFPILPLAKARIAQLPARHQKVLGTVGSVVCIGLLALCVLTLAGGAYSPFIYFRF